MNREISGGAIAILRQMCKYKLKLNGDPAKDVPWFYVPTDVSQKVKQTGVDEVDTPAFKYCLELIERGLIHLDSGSGEFRAASRKAYTYG